MSYQDIGYDPFLTRTDEYSTNTQELDPLQFERFTQDISGNKIQGGALVSSDGRVVFDLENNILRINDGNQDRVILGTLPDDSTGLLIQDQDGNKILQVSGSINIFQSAGGNFSIDTVNEQLLVKENGTTRILIGKLTGGF